MKSVLLATVAFVLIGSPAAFAAAPRSDDRPVLSSDADGFIQEARQNRGGDGQRGGDGNSRGHDDSDDHDDDHDDDRDDDHDSGHGGASGDDDGPNHDLNDDNGGSNTKSKSKRRKPRIPGGSGCDDAGDIAEHAECRG